MKIPVLCTLIITAMLTNTTQAKTSLSYKIDDLEYQPHQIMTDDEMASTTGKAIPLVLIPVLWGMATGASINVADYLISSASENKKPELKRALFETAKGATMGGLTGLVPAFGGPMSAVAMREVIANGGALAFFKGLEGYIFDDNAKHKSGPSLKRVPTNDDMLKVLNNPNWANEHFNQIPGFRGDNLKEKMNNAIKDPQSWKKITERSCIQCH
ncbi:hypothetical protein ACH8LF_004749 [Escherichia coli]|nr:hypothetical protein [Escherichia coli]